MTEGWEVGREIDAWFETPTAPLRIEGVEFVSPWKARGTWGTGVLSKEG